MSLEQQFLSELLDAIKNDRLNLPTLPEVALRIREAVEDPDVSAGKLATVVGQDAALAARIIKVANSPLLRGRIQVDNLQLAITRLGITFVRNLVTGLAMQQMFQATSDLVDSRLRAVWEHSTEVASICHVLASHYTKLKPDQAMLAGLVHEIGMLPILTLAEESPEMMSHPDILDRVIDKLHPQVGTAILKAWGFPPELVAVPEGCVDFGRQAPKADYVDLVTVAKLQSYAGGDHALATISWNDVPAFARVGLATDVQVHDIEDISNDIAEAKRLFG
ncbi:HDOD domain-containing protein [Permianibacter sp. IMCC34836]|uniref:HDOD domain-containing protein n=1 Tax=Permianibacter fluminis TaxID=2738515 RepID=UPI0015565DDA|nr:HDOD domain-containing protein [Permianibacter fluminis]NQD37345.1 HDOD domain-containing protein [Permianibacter fluminis]